MSNDHTPSNGGLSGAGEARRRAILDLLHARLDACIRRRRRVRAGVAAASMIVMTAVVWAALPGARPAGTRAPDARNAHNTPAPPPTTAPSPADLTVGAAPAASVHATVRIVATPPLDAAPCGASPAPTVCLLSDEQLLAALAEAGHPSGLIRIGDRAIVVPRSGRTSDGPH